MGHLVNPLSFRLSITSYWKVNSLNYFNNRYKYSILYFYDKILYNFLEWLFNYRWVAGFFFKRFKKNILFKKYLKRKLKRLGSRRRFSKIKLSLIFKRLWLYIFFYNPFVKRLKKKIKRRINFRLKKKRRRKPIKLYIRKLLFSKKYLYFFFFKRRCRIIKLFFRRFFVFKFYRKRKHFRLFYFLKRYFLPELSHIVIYRSGFYSSKILLYFSNPIMFNILSFRKLKKKISWKSKLILSRYKFLKIYNILNKINIIISLKNSVFFFFKVFLVILSYFPLLFKFLKKKTIINMKFFIFKFYKKFFFKLKKSLLYLILNNSFSIYRYYIKFKRFFFFSFIERFRLKRKLNILSNFSLLFIKNFFEKRWVFFLKNIINKFIKFKLSFFIYFIPSNIMSSKMLFNFFCKHLRRKRPINRILNMILWDIKKQRMLIGFKILMAGRFTRKERALYKWIVHKQTPLSLYSSNLDYFSGFFKSRFGVSSFKIWIFKK